MTCYFSPAMCLLYKPLSLLGVGENLHILFTAQHKGQCRAMPTAAPALEIKLPLKSVSAIGQKTAAKPALKFGKHILSLPYCPRKKRGMASV